MAAALGDDEIRVSAVVLRDDAGRLLTVRKRGTTRFMLPGGKPEPGESSEEAAIRECREELGLELDVSALRLLGQWRADAANEAGKTVAATVFEHPQRAVVAPSAELEELRWLDIGTEPTPNDLAPLVAHWVVPALVAQTSDPELRPRDASASRDQAPVVQRSTAKRFWRVVNPLARPLAGLAPWWVLLETTGRTSGLKRQVPLAKGPVDGDTAWLIAAHGMHSDLGRNIAATPEVRLRLRGRWRTGVAEMVPIDEAMLPKFNAYARSAFAFAIDPMLVKISLDPLSTD